MLKAHAHFVGNPSRNVAALIASVFFLFPFSSSAQNLDHKVSQYMHAQVEIDHFTGAILIAKNNEVLVSGEYGRSNGLAEQRVRDHKYRLGSIGKPFIAAAILQLQERGELKVQDSICNYIAKCPSSWQRIKIFNLLTQTDGIPEVALDTKTTIPTPALLADLKARPIEFNPGEKLGYGDSGYEILGAVIEKVSGQPYLQYLKQHIFIPLGMHETGYDDPREIHADADRNLIGRSDSITPDDLESAIPYSLGRLYSTVEDLYRWDRALHGEELLSKESRAAMFAPSIDGRGLGWAVLKEFGRRVNTDAAGIDLFGSAIRDYPDDGVCVIVLGDSRDTDSGRISRDLAAIFFGKHYELPVVHDAITLAPALYRSYVGHYEMATGFVLTVSSDDNQLMIQSPNRPTIKIFPESDTRFFAKGLDVVINFVENAQGTVSELVLQQGGGDIPVPRID